MRDEGIAVNASEQSESASRSASAHFRTEILRALRRHAQQLDCRCEACLARTQLPQACGHRACPHCQHDVGADWLHQQRRLRLPVDYFLLTFTLPAQLRSLARRHPREVYAALMQCA